MQKISKEVIPVTTNIHRIECGSSWNQLTKRERMYAYYMSRAAWEGSKICYFQRSYESPALFVLLQLVFSQNMDTLKTSALSQGVSEDEWKQMLAYSAAVFQNCGNYHSFGDTKFIPELNVDQFKKVYKASESYQVYS